MTGVVAACAVAAVACGRLNFDDRPARGTPVFADDPGAGLVSAAPIGCDYCGIGWDDYDLDGWQDVFIAGHGLFHNDGNGVFRWTLPDVGTSRRGSHWGDYDNDGLPDHVVSKDVTLRHNNGDGTFSVVDPTVAGLAVPMPNIGDTGWLDVNHDGWLDLVALYDEAEGNLIFVNDGDGTFTKLTSADTGLLPLENGEVGSVIDYDGDGDTDILYSAAELHLWRNHGDLTFSEVSSTAGVSARCAPGDPSNGYCGLAFADFDHDGHLDLFVGNIVEDQLYRARGDGTFVDVTVDAGVAGASVRTVGVAFADYDQDGDLDLAVGRADGVALYRNDGGGHFEDVAAALGIDPTLLEANVMWADVDNDGDLDLLLATPDALHLYRNQVDDTWHLAVLPVGRGAGGSPRDGTGSRVELLDDTGTHLLAMRVVSGSTGMGSHAPRLQHFGLAEAWGGPDARYLVRVRFSSGQVAEAHVVPTQVTSTVGARVLAQTVTITEP